MKTRRFSIEGIVVLIAMLLAAMTLVGCGAKDKITPPAQPFVEVYLDKLMWQNKVMELAGDSAILEFPTTPTNVILANEVSSLRSNLSLGTTITFDSANTNYPFQFYLQAMSPGHTLVWDDLEGTDLHPATPAGYRDRTISVGDTDDAEDDDFELGTFDWAEGCKVLAIGIEVIDNAPEDSEYIAVHCVDTLLDSTFYVSLDCNGTASFLGIVSSEPILKIMFNENPNPDDMFVRDFYFGIIEEPK
jgi:hypothetical protein